MESRPIIKFRESYWLLQKLGKKKKKTQRMARPVLPPFSVLVNANAPNQSEVRSNRNFPVTGIVAGRRYNDAVFGNSLFAPRTANRPTVGQRVDLPVALAPQPFVAQRADAVNRGVHGEWQGGQWQNGLFVPDFPVQGHVGWRSDDNSAPYVPPIHTDDRWRVITGYPNGVEAWHYFRPTEWGRTFAHVTRFNNRVHTTNLIFASSRSNRVIRFIIPLLDQGLIRLAAFSILYQIWNVVKNNLSANDIPVRVIPYMRTRNVEANQEYQSANYPRDIELPPLDLGLPLLNAAKAHDSWDAFVGAMPNTEIPLNRNDARNVLWRREFEWIVQGMIAQVNRSKNSQPNFLLVLATDVVLVTKIPAGGCSDTAPLDTRRGDYMVYRPRNQGNNCFFHCIGIRKRGEINEERRWMGLSYDAMVSVADIGRSRRSPYIRVIQLNEDFEEDELRPSQVSPEETTTLLLENGHFMRVEAVQPAVEERQQHKCTACGKVYKRVHSCLYKKTTYYQEMVRRQGYTVRPIYHTKGQNANLQYLFFDIETFPARFNEDRGIDVLLPYAVGWQIRDPNHHLHSDVRVEIGPNALCNFVRYLKDCRNTVVVAYNGSAFDFIILIEEMIRQEVTILDVGLHENRLQSCRFGQNNKFFDLYRFTLSSLKDCAKAFGVTHQKGSFPHKFIRSFEDLSYVGPFSTISSFYDEKDEKPNIGAHEIVSARELVSDYLKLDIRTMVDVFDTVNDEFYLSENQNVTDYLTIGSYIYQKWLREYALRFPSTPLYTPKNDSYLYMACRESFYGGRSYGIINTWRHPQIESIRNRTIPFSAIRRSDAMSYYDVNSLYAHVMRINSFPVDKHYVLSDRDAPAFMREHLDSLPLGLYCCDVIPPKNLLHPVLPRRENGVLQWDLLPQESQWHVSEELILAMELGYQVKILHGVYWPNKEKIFEFFIEEAHAKKQQARREGNEVKATLAKQALVSLFGKQGQLPNTQKSMIVDSAAELDSFMKKNNLVGLRRIGEQSFLAIGERGDPVEFVNRAMHLASFITAFSRIFMYREVFLRGDPSGVSIPKTVFYTDTDCAVMLGMDQRPEFEGILGNELGQLKNELPEGSIMIELVVIAPKVWGYSVVMPDFTVKEFHKCKGVPSEKISHQLYSDYCENPTKSFQFQYDLIHPNTMHHAIVNEDDIELPLFSIIQQRVSVSVNSNMNLNRDLKNNKTQGNITVSTPFGFEEI